jgi:hypothetical protein
MENTMEHRKSRDPEADTFFLGRSIVEDPEFNEQTVLHENITPPTGTFETSQANENFARKSPNRRDIAASDLLSVPESEGFSAPIRDASNNANSSENLYEAVVVTDRPRRTNATTILLAAFGISAIIAAMVVLGVCFSAECGSNDGDKNLPPPPTHHPTASPSVPPTDVLRERVVREFVNNISYLDREIIVNGTSAESRALSWLIQGDTLFNASVLMTLNSQYDNDVSFRLRQRYPLVTLWYQQVDSEGNYVYKWVNTSGWLENESECNWYGIICDENKTVVQISFFDFEKNVSNKYVGSIPPDIGLLTSLQAINIRLGNVSGTIPEFIGQCKQMIFFTISHGSVSGTIPSSLGQWTNIFLFDVSNNKINGTIPETITNWMNITGFILQVNLLSGSIPSFIGQWSRLQYFLATANQLTNTIPDEIGNLVDLNIFAVTENQLMGTLPSSIGRMTVLQNFYVDHNKLTGTIPSSIGNWSQISEAFFNSNKFTGTMPQEICNIIQKNDSLVCDCNINTCCTSCG